MQQMRQAQIAMLIEIDAIPTKIHPQGSSVWPAQQRVGVQNHEGGGGLHKGEVSVCDTLHISCTVSTLNNLCDVC